MPNWCFTHCTITSTQKEIKNLYENLKKATTSGESHMKSNGFGDEWLGNIVSYLGLWKTRYENNNNHISCRGYIVDYYLNDERDLEDNESNILTIDFESAWSPHLEPIKLLQEKYAPNAKFIYEAEECGNELYWTNDFDLSDMVIVDNFGTGELFPEKLKPLYYDEKFLNKEDFLNEVKVVFPDETINGVDDANRVINDYINEFNAKENNNDEDIYLHINEYTYVTIEETF